MQNKYSKKEIYSKLIEMLSIYADLNNTNIDKIIKRQDDKEEIDSIFDFLLDSIMIKLNHCINFVENELSEVDND